MSRAPDVMDNPHYVAGMATFVSRQVTEDGKTKYILTNNVHNTRYVTKKELNAEVSRDFAKQVRKKLCPDKCCWDREPYGQVGSRFAIKQAIGKPAKFYLVDTQAPINDPTVSVGAVLATNESVWQGGYDKGYREGYNFGVKQGHVEGRKALADELEAEEQAFAESPAMAQAHALINTARKALAALQELDYTPTDVRNATPFEITARLAVQSIAKLEEQYYQGELVLTEDV